MAGKKNKYTIVEEKNGWGRLKSGAGWISLSYTKKVAASTGTTFTPYLITTTCDVLNIRSGAGTGYSVVGAIREVTGKKNKYTIVEEKNGLTRALIEETTLEDISESYRPVVDIIGIEKFIELSEYAKGDELYFPKTENIIAPARNRRIKKEWNGYNSKELAEKYNLTTKQIGNILKDEPMIGQMSIFDMNNDD